jgi:hypothetical protein
MGWRFSKRIKVLPGVSVNLSKSGLSTSIGPRGAKVTIGHRKVRQTVGIPGTGLSYTETKTLSGPTHPKPIELPSPIPESGWTVAGRVVGKIVFWLTIGAIVAFGMMVLALIFSGGGQSKRRRR